MTDTLTPDDIRGTFQRAADAIAKLRAVCDQQPEPERSRLYAAISRMADDVKYLDDFIEVLRRRRARPAAIAAEELPY